MVIISTQTGYIVTDDIRNASIFQHRKIIVPRQKSGAKCKHDSIDY